MFKDAVALVVDDQGTIRSIIVKILKEHLHFKEIFQAPSAARGIELLETEKAISWIFSDWEMPGMKGDEFLQIVRANPETSHLPFLLITSMNEKEILVTAAHAGVSEILIKPFTPTLMIDKVRKVAALTERRAAERFKANIKVPVNVQLEYGVGLSASLDNISETGILVKTQIPKNTRAPYVYNEAGLTIHGTYGVVQLKANIVRIEVDQNSQFSHQFIVLAFHISEIDYKNREKLQTFIEILKEKAPELVS